MAILVPSACCLRRSAMSAAASGWAARAESALSGSSDDVPPDGVEEVLGPGVAAFAGVVGMAEVLTAGVAGSDGVAAAGF